MYDDRESFLGFVEPSRGAPGGFDSFAPWSGEQLGTFVSLRDAGLFLRDRAASPAFGDLWHLSEFAGSGP